MQFRNFIVALIGTTLSVTAAVTAHAQSFPNKPVKITTPFPVGSGPDVILRVIADRLSRNWKQPVVVDNKPGASGFIAIEVVKRARPDGYDLVQMDNAQMSAQPYLFKKLPYDLLRDFEPVTPILRNYFFVVVPTASPFKSTSDLLIAAKAKPDSVDYGSWFIGSPGHLGASMLEVASGTRMNHVPYKEMTQLYTAVGNKEIAWAFGSAASAGAMQRAGRVRYLAVAAPNRVAGFPEVPTVSESGGPANFELSAWVALLAPKGTPKAVIEKIQKDVGDVLKEPEVRERYATLFYEPYSLNTEQFQQQLKNDSVRFGETIKLLNISLD